MLDHLDDPQPFVPGTSFRAAVQRRARRRQWRRRLAVSSTAVVAVAVGVTSAGVLYVDRRDAAIDRVAIAAPPSTDGAVNVLLVGLDRAATLPNRPPGVRADSMAILRLDADGSIHLLSLPRDLYDPALGGRLDASAADGPQAVVDAVTSLTGIPVDHYVQLDMDGLTGLVAAAGGLRVQSDVRLVDSFTGLDLAAGQCVDLDGPTALALVRSRHVQGDPSNDLGRDARQRDLLQLALVALAGAGHDPAEIDRLSRVLADHAVLDDGLTLGELVHLAGRIDSTNAAAATGELVPVTDATVEGLDVLTLTDGATATLQRFGAPAGPAASPAATGTTAALPPQPDHLGHLSAC